MKKIYSFIILMLFSINLSVAADKFADSLVKASDIKDAKQTIVELDADKKDKKKVALKKLISVLSSSTTGVNTAFNWTSDRIEKMIFTRKGFIQALLLFTPLYSIYSHYYSPQISRRFIEFFIGSIASGAVNVTDAVINTVFMNKDKIIPLLAEYSELKGEFGATIVNSQEAGEFYGFWDSFRHSKITVGVVSLAKAAAWTIPVIAKAFIESKFKKQ